MAEQPANDFFGAAVRRHWLLEEGMAFLNHGSYGATPIAVLDAERGWRERMERQPVRFMNSEMPPALRQAAAALAGFLGARGEHLVFVENATVAVNAVLRSLDLGPGDEIALFQHAYPAVRNAAHYAASRCGARVRPIVHPFPVPDEDALIAAFEAGLSPQVRLAILDHVSSPLAIVYPLERLVAICRRRGIRVLVDGAHGPGMLPLDLERLGADWYTGNCHKWLFAPKGCGFLWATPDAPEIHPLAISNHYGEGFLAEFDWVGTRDCSAWLAITAAIEFWQAMEARGASTYRRELLRGAARLLCDRWEVSLPAPETMYGALATLPLPDAGEASMTRAFRIHDALWERHAVEVPVLCFADRLWLRISAQVYNVPADYDRLARALPEVLAQP